MKNIMEMVELTKSGNKYSNSFWPHCEWHCIEKTGSTFITGILVLKHNEPTMSSALVTCHNKSNEKKIGLTGWPLASEKILNLSDIFISFKK